MYKDVLRSLEDATIFPVIAIIIFTLFFVGLLIWVIRMDKKEINLLASIPLDEEEGEVQGAFRE